MTNRVKGLLKGLRYISQIFDEEKEPEMKIGLPTDVKHVAHIGWDDGPAVDSPGWMKDYESSGGGQQSTPLNDGESKEKQGVKKVTEDSKRGGHPDLPKSTRRHSSTETPSSGATSPKKERRHPRRHHLKDSENSKYNRDGSVGSDSTAGELSDIPKKSHRKKSHRPSKSRGSDSSLLACSSDEETSFEPYKS